MVLNDNENTVRYRGTITSCTDTQEGKELIIAGEKGIKFPKSEVKVLVPFISLSEEMPEVGKMAEVVLPTLDAEGDKAITVITSTIYSAGEEELCYNGKVKSIYADLDFGQLLMTTGEGPLNETLFIFDFENTKFSIDPQEIRVGDMLHIFTNGMATRSIPPQRPAIEIHLYR